MDRKAAAEARRAKVLARGTDRLAKITGGLSEPPSGAAAHAVEGAPDALQQAQQVQQVQQQEQQQHIVPPNVAAGAGATSLAATPAPAPASASVAPKQQAAQPSGTSPATAAAEAAHPFPAAASASDMGAALLKSTTSAQSLPKAQHHHQQQQQQQEQQQEQRRTKGTATNSKWAQYEAAGAGGSGGGAPRQARRRRSVRTGETLHAAVRSTSRPRLLLAALLAVLLASRWDAAAVSGSSAGVEIAGEQSLPPAPPPAGSVSGWWAEAQARWQGLARQARLAGGAVQQAFGQQAQRGPSKPAQQNGGKRASLASAVAAAVQAGGLGRLKSQVAATPAGQRAAAVAQQAQQALASMAATPAAQQAQRVIHAAGCQLARAAASPAAVQAGEALRVARSRLGDSCRMVISQLAAARASPFGQQAGAALARLPHLAGSLPGMLRSQLAAVADTPWGQHVLSALDRMPPLAALLLLDLSLIGAAALAMAAAPGLVHSTLELDLQAPGLLQRLAGLVPGLSSQLSLLAAVPRLLTGLLDDAAAFMAVLLAYYQLPALLAGTGAQ